MTVWPGDAQRGDEMSFTLRWLARAALLQQTFDPRHRFGKIPGITSPASGMDSRLAVKRVDAKPGIVSKGRQRRGPRRCVGFDSGVGRKRRAGLLRFRKAEFAGRDRVYAVRREQV